MGTAAVDAAVDGDGDGVFKTLEEFRAAGILWALNVHVFHPRGFSLAFEVADGTEEVGGWMLLGDGTEPWYMPDEIADPCFKAFEALLAAHRRVD